MPKNKSHNLFDELKSIFLSGFFTLLPITLTFLIFRASFRILRGWIAPLHKLEPTFLHGLPYHDLIFIILFIFLIGIILKFFVLKKLIHSIEESIFYRIPILKNVYSGIKQLVQGLTQQDEVSFNRVVLIEFPKSGTYSIGFLTGQFPKRISPIDETTFYCIFVPTTPNPTTGFFVLAKKEDIKEIDLTKQEAMAIIISGGIVKPDRFK